MQHSGLMWNDDHSRFSQHPSSRIDAMERRKEKRKKNVLLVMGTGRIDSVHSFPHTPQQGQLWSACGHRIPRTYLSCNWTFGPFGPLLPVPPAQPSTSGNPKSDLLFYEIHKSLIKMIERKSPWNVNGLEGQIMNDYFLPFYSNCRFFYNGPIY